MTMRRSTAFAIAAGTTLLTLSGCSPSGHATPTPTTSAASLPDLKPTALPVDDKVLIEKDGSGSTTLDLTGKVGTAKDVTVSFVCAGTGDVQVSDSSSSKVLVGAPCATTVRGAAIDSGKVPVADVSSLRWNLDADTATHWRVIVYTDH